MLTSHDLIKIKHLFQSELILFEKNIVKKIDQRADEIIEYIDSNIENHEKRISKLEDDCSVMQQQLK